MSAEVLSAGNRGQPQTEADDLCSSVFICGYDSYYLIKGTPKR